MFSIILALAVAHTPPSHKPKPVEKPVYETIWFTAPSTIRGFEKQNPEDFNCKPTGRTQKSSWYSDGDDFEVICQVRQVPKKKKSHR